MYGCRPDINTNITQLMASTDNGLCLLSSWHCEWYYKTYWPYHNSPWGKQVTWNCKIKMGKCLQTWM